MQGIRKARKPPASPSKNVFHKVFQASGAALPASFGLLFSAAAATELSGERIGATAETLSGTDELSAVISVNSRPLIEVSAACASTRSTELKKIRVPMTSVFTLIQYFLNMLKDLLYRDRKLYGFRRKTLLIITNHKFKRTLYGRICSRIFYLLLKDH